ncbi:MAG: hypothetical protein LBF16_06325 [Pseudomonadales bacterium]|jgi:hypothetical protein|nr:hypothetical protein [Pseudomonadales bacterium]
MPQEAPSRHAGPVVLSALFDDALSHLKPPQPEIPVGDGFLFSGSRHESVPRALFLDRRLTPLERNAWQVFRLRLNGDGVTAFPTYDELRPYLASMPCAGQASHETVARALTLLRLTRWLSLVRRRRDPKTGRILGNLYVLHDEPLTPFEAMQLDAEYLSLVSHVLDHPAKAVRMVGLNTLKEITEDPLLTGRLLPTRLQVLAERMARGGWEQSYPQEPDEHDSEESSQALLRNTKPLASESEAGWKPAPDGSLRNPKQDRTVRSSFNKVRTVRASAMQHLDLPDQFHRLKAEQQAGAMMALQQVEETQRQAVLDEWAIRCQGTTVHNPAGYLFGIIQKAIRGEFHARSGQSEAVTAQPSPSPPSPPPASYKPASRETVQAHLAKLRTIMQRT